MLSRDDVGFIKRSFEYAMQRMQELDALSTWGSMEVRYKRLRETEEQQKAVLDKLESLIQEN